MHKRTKINIAPELKRYVFEGYMAKKTSRQAIEKKINRSLASFVENDMEEALFQIAPVINVIAKERYPKVKFVGEMIKSYILDEQDIIFYLSTQGILKLPKGVQIMMVDDENCDQVPSNVQHIKSHAAQLADYIYHNMRCAETHDAEIDHDIIDLGRNFGIAREKFEGDGGDLAPGKFIVSNATVLAIVLTAIASPEIRRIKLDGSIKLYNSVLIDKKQLVGNRLYLEKSLEKLFVKKT